MSDLYAQSRLTGRHVRNPAGPRGAGLRAMPVVMLLALPLGTAACRHRHAATPAPATAGVHPGIGWQSTAARPSDAASCLQAPPPKPAGPGDAVIAVVVPSTLAALRPALGLDGPSSFGPGVFGGDRRVQYLTSGRTDHFTPRLLLTITWARQSLDPGSARLDPAVATAAGAEFYRRCGDSFVAEIDDGFAVLVSARPNDPDAERRVAQAFAAIARGASQHSDATAALDGIIAALVPVQSATDVELISHRDHVAIAPGDIAARIGPARADANGSYFWSVRTAPYLTDDPSASDVVRRADASASAAGAYLERLAERRDAAAQARADLGFFAAGRTPWASSRRRREFEEQPFPRDVAELDARADAVVGGIGAAARRCAERGGSACGRLPPRPLPGVELTRTLYLAVTGDVPLRAAPSLASAEVASARSGDLFRVVSTPDEEEGGRAAGDVWYAVRLLHRRLWVRADSRLLRLTRHEPGGRWPRAGIRDSAAYAAVRQAVTNALATALCGGRTGDAVSLVVAESDALARAALDALHAQHTTAVRLERAEAEALVRGWDRIPLTPRAGEACVAGTR